MPGSEYSQRFRAVDDGVVGQPIARNNETYSPAAADPPMTTHRVGS